MVTKDLEKVKELLCLSRIEQILPSKEVAMKMMASGKRLTFYLGIDPTAPNIHLGHTIPLLLLKKIAELGHQIIILIGDFTARIGDPTDKESARKALTEGEVRSNMRTYVEQVKKVLGGVKFEVKYNSKWLDKMSFKDVIKLSSGFTVQQMIARDMFQERIKKEKPIFVHEFLYPLMQGYDSVAMKVDGEVGGNDQMFNMLVGRDLVKTYLGKEKLVFMTKLLVDADTNRKVSKTEAKFIFVNDAPEEIFGKTMGSIPDEMVKTVFELCTEKPQSRIDKRWEEVKKSGGYKEFKEELAYELVRMYHGESKAQKAKKEFDKVFSGGQLPEKPEEFHISGDSVDMLPLLKDWLNVSTSEAKRLLSQGAVDVDGAVIREWSFKIKKGSVIKAGPHRFLKAV